MVYLPELYYFFDTQGFLLEDAVRVTAKAIGPYCRRYSVELLSPKMGVKETKREGELPFGKEECRSFVEDIVTWVFENTATPEVFGLHFATEDGGGKFDHHDDTCCWMLNITKDEFNEIKEEWRKNGLPEDLFYEEGKETRVERPLNIMDRFLTLLGFTIDSTLVYTPKRWEAKCAAVRKK